LVKFTAIWYICWSFGIFFPFWYIVERKIWQPWTQLPLEKFRHSKNPRANGLRFRLNSASIVIFANKKISPEKNRKTGANVMIKIFSDFFPIFGPKNWRFS
jgi:hypothetical protein